MKIFTKITLLTGKTLGGWEIWRSTDMQTKNLDDQRCTFSSKMYFIYIYGLVVRVSDYRSRGPGSIPGATRFSEK
jgi:hypothetical protein